MSEQERAESWFAMVSAAVKRVEDHFERIRQEKAAIGALGREAKLFWKEPW